MIRDKDNEGEFLILRAASKKGYGGLETRNVTLIYSSMGAFSLSARHVTWQLRVEVGKHDYDILMISRSSSHSSTLVGRRRVTHCMLIFLSGDATKFLRAARNDRLGIMLAIHDGAGRRPYTLSSSD